MPARRCRPATALRRGFAAALATTLLAACTATVGGRGAGVAHPGSAAASGSRTPSVSVSPSPQAPARFTDCSSQFDLAGLPFPAGRTARLSFTCARLSVPLDYHNPSGKSVTIGLLKVHDTNNTTGNDLVVNPGGPGASGIELAVDLSFQVSDRLLAHFDLLGFDPRGVGRSSPVTCTTDTEKDLFNAATPDVLTATGFSEAKRLAQGVASKCNAKYGSSLADFNTVQTAMDMDRIRAAVGDSLLSYLGFSYGTELGSIYAHLFPDHVRVAVLDGAVDPLIDDLTASAHQLQGFESAFDQFATDCLTRSPCKSLGNPRQAVYDVVKRAHQTPLKIGDPTHPRSATGAIVLTGVLYALYSQTLWPALGQALNDAQNGDAKGLFRLADSYNRRSPTGHYANISDANTTINCNDAKPGPSDATVQVTALKWAHAYPMFGLWAAPSLFSCQVWQPVRTPVPLPSAATPEQVLVVGNLHDPATPYQGAKDLTRALGHARLLTWDGEGHTSYLSGSSCIDTYVDDYLTTGTVPPPNKTCPR